MAQYEMPARNPYIWQFRAMAAVSIVLLLAALFISLRMPDTLTDSTSKEIAWAAIAILVVSLVGVMWLAVRHNSWELKRQHRIEMVDGKISQRNDAGVLVVVDLGRIDSIYETPAGWLLVRGTGTEEPIGIPPGITGYGEIRRELVAHHAIQPPGLIGFGRMIVPIVTVAGLAVAMFVPRGRPTRLTLESVVALQVLWALITLRAARSRSEAAAMAVLSALVLGLCCWVLYAKAIAH